METNGQLNAPEITISAANGKTNTGWFNKEDGAVTITIKDTTTEAISGATGIEYKIYNGGQQIEANTKQGRECEFTYTGADGDNLSITAYLTGNDKNKAESGTPTTAYFKRDIQPPNTPSLSVGECKETTIAVEAGSTDVTSGIASYKFEYSTTSGTNWQTPNNSDHGLKTVENLNTCTYTYEGLQDNTTFYFKVTVTDNAGNTSSNAGTEQGTTEKATYKPNAETDIGKYVNYSPKFADGSETKSYTAKAEYTDASEDSTITTDTNMKWRIWNVTDSMLVLVSTTPVLNSSGTDYQTIYMRHVQAYNNGVYLLNKICETCFSNSDFPGMIARSMNIEDLKAVHPATTNKDYGKTTTKTYTPKVDIPTMYVTHDAFVESPDYSSLSVQQELVPDDTKVTSAENIKVYISSWTGPLTEGFTNPIYAELVTYPASPNSPNLTRCWLASRVVNYSNSYDEPHFEWGLHQLSQNYALRLRVRCIPLQLEQQGPSDHKPGW